MIKNLPAIARVAGNAGSIHGSGGSSGIENGSSLQYSCLENSKDREAWRTTVLGFTKSLTRLSMHTKQSKACNL